MTLFESAIRRDCLGPRSFDRYYPRFTRAAMVRGDLASRSAALATQRQNGIINANEWRAFEELDPISDADGGNTYIVNAAAAPLSARPGAVECTRRRCGPNTRARALFKS